MVNTSMSFRVASTGKPQGGGGSAGGARGRGCERFMLPARLAAQETKKRARPPTLARSPPLAQQKNRPSHAQRAPVSRKAKRHFDISIFISLEPRLSPFVQKCQSQMAPIETQESARRRQRASRWIPRGTSALATSSQPACF